MQTCCPAGSLSVKSRITVAALMHHGSHGDDAPDPVLPEGFSVFRPIATLQRLITHITTMQ